ncbi:MAG TPA: hypothetical protein DIC60_03710 [Lachnospiraceae bacterium]|nr:hypothetical protein [Lachnospiraceae bacterium]
MTDVRNKGIVKPADHTELTELIESSLNAGEKSLQGEKMTQSRGKQTTKGLWLPENYIKIKSGRIIELNKIIGVDLFDGLVLKSNALADSIIKCEDERHHIETRKIGEKELDLIYEFGRLNRIRIDGYNIKLGSREVEEIEWKERGTDKKLNFKWEKGANGNLEVYLVHESHRRGRDTYNRISVPVDGLEVRIAVVDSSVLTKEFHVGKAKIIHRGINGKLDPDDGTPCDEFKMVLHHRLGEDGVKAWEEIHSYLRCALDRAGWATSNAMNKERYTKLFIDEQNYKLR